MIIALDIIAVEQTNNIEATTKKVVQLLNYAVTYPKYITRYHTSGMTLHVHSDSYFLSTPGTKSRVVYHYLSTPSTNPTATPKKPPPLNVPIQV